MNILEIAKECGFHLDFLNDKYTSNLIEAFAAAVIEEYKASLVPVAYEVTANDGKVFLLENNIVLNGHTSIPLYAFPKETK